MFSYTTLHDSQFRLLRILGRDDSGRIVARLENVPYQGEVAYACTSYSWNGEIPSTEIRCNEESLLITPTVLELLSVLLAAGGVGTPLWIDGICINQTDNEEKAKQVPLMDVFYQNASQVIVWLGSAGEHTRNALENIESVSEKLDKAKGQVPTKESVTLVLEKYKIPPREDAFWVGLKDLYSRKWFTRIWTLQEFVFAGNTVLYCGETVVDFENFCHLTQALDNVLGRYYFMDFLHSEKSTGHQLLQQAFGAKTASYRGPGRIVQLALSRDVSEPVDKVYGIMGLLSQGTKAKINVDYSVDSKVQYWKVYLQLGYAMLEEFPEDLVETASETKSTLDELPSWCPDLAGSKKPIERLHPNLYNAGGSGVSEAYTKPKIFPADKSVEVQGFLVDFVEECNDEEWQAQWSGEIIERAYNSSSIRKEAARKIVAWLRSSEAISKRANPDQKGPSLAKVLVAGTTMSIETGEADKTIYYTMSQELFNQLFLLAMAFLSATTENPDTAWNGAPNDRQIVSHINRYVNTMIRFCSGRKVFRTELGFLGLGPGDIKQGDWVCIFYGWSTPIILRKNTSSRTYKVIGQAYVDDIMKGDLISMPYEKIIFKLV